MQELIERFTTYLQTERNASPHTVKAYTEDLRQFYIWLKELNESANLEITAIDRLTIRAYLAALLRQEVSKRSVTRKLSSVKSFFTFLIKREILNANPADDVRTPTFDKKLPTFLDQETVQRMMTLPEMSTFAGVRARAILELFYSTGMRLSELVALDRHDISMESCTVRVMGKRRKERIIPFGNPAKEALNNYFSTLSNSITGSSNSYDHSAVFLNKSGRRLSKRSVYSIVHTFMEKGSNRMKCSPHVLRHSFATHMLDRGADLQSISELLGHENLSTTQLYTHVSTEQLKRVYAQSHPRA